MYMIFDDENLKDKFTILEVRGRGILSNDIELIEVEGRAGAYFSKRNIPVRQLEVDIVVASKSPSNLREDIRDLNRILSVDKPKGITFSDDDKITYYGIPAETTEDGEVVSTSRNTIVFICADPYSYSPEIEHDFEFDVTELENKGAEDAEPIFELKALDPVTFAMVQNQDNEYQMIGEPADDEVEAVDTKESVLFEDGRTIDEWESASIDMVDINIDSVDGEMGTDDGGIRAEIYGTAKNKQRGPAVFKELDNAIQDFELEASFDIISRRESENFRMMIYLHDENMNNIGHVGVKDNSRLYKRRVPLGRAGGHHEGNREGHSVLGDSSDYNNNARDTTLFYLRMKRTGTKFDFYIGEWQNQKHINVWEGTYSDVDEKWDGKVKYVTLFIGSYRDRGTPARIRMNSVELFEHKTTVEDQTPYIAYAGDVITFDHKEGELIINGESKKDIKDFGGTYFKLKKGKNQLVVHPADSFQAKVKYKETHR